MDTAAAPSQDERKGGAQAKVLVSLQLKIRWTVSQPVFGL